MKNPVQRHFLPRDNQKHIAQFRKISPVILNSEQHSKLTTNRLVSSGLTPYSGEWTEQQVAHLLRRTTFGLKKDDLRSFAQMSLNDALASIIRADPDPSIPINDYHYPEDGIIDPDIAPGESWIEAPYNNEYEGARLISLKGWLINNMIHQPTTIHEKMILFWHNLLVTESWGVFIAKSSYQYFQLLRHHALGNYKEMIKAITTDVAMLFYLNGTFNNKAAPDENYARELQELFCIGKGPNAKFTESDVQAAARVLTGFVVDWDSVLEAGVPHSFFYPDFHDTSDKQFSDFYGNRVITGQSGLDGASELDELIDMIFDNSETALFICRRLYQFFVYSEIDEQTEQNIIVPLAQIFRESDYDILPVLQSLLASEHFFDSLNMGAMIKSPVDFLVGLWRTIQVPDLDDPGSLKRLLQHRSMLWNMAAQGMEIGDPPSVSGWPAYYQVPQLDKYWITTDTITNRAISADSLWFWGFWVDANNKVYADLIQFIGSLDQPEDINQMLAQVTQLTLGIAPSQGTMDRIKSVLLDGQDQDYYWTNAWNQYQQNPEDQQIKSVISNRLKYTFQYIFQLGECQLM